MATKRIKGGRKLDAFLRKAKNAKGVREIEVGFYSTAKYPDGTPVPAVAAFNEFGTKNIPERPFFRLSIPHIERDGLAYLKSVVDPETMVITRRMANKLGLIGQKEIRRSITALKSPPNAPRTISLKGSSNPLLDTGFMRQSVTWKVVG